MKLWLKTWLLFTTAQVVVTLAAASAVVMVTRATVEEMVEIESRNMVSAIAETIDLFPSTNNQRADRVPEALRSYVLDRTIGETGFYFVLNPDGEYLIHPKEDVQGQNWAGEEPFIDYILANSDGAPQDRFVRYISPKTGAPKQVYFNTVPSTGWIVCSSAWEEEMYAPIGTIVIAVLAILGGGLLLTTLLSLYTSRRVGGTLGSIAEALAQVGTGDLTVSVDEDKWSRETNLASISGRISKLDETIEHNQGSVAAINSSIMGVDERISDQTAMVEESEAAAGINEMNIGVKEISESMQILSDLNQQLSDVITQLDDGVSVFHTGQEEL